MRSILFHRTSQRDPRKNPAQPSSLEDLETDVDILPHLLVFFFDNKILFSLSYI